ncbi:endo-1,3;1,4-beta-D-glucanase-like [Humulus lupulus]|uniref:endo-1,3;1,4-beta-D-glucanase-like n=1 Tax=Humulus lupulus TaxID=3486 RepID=UPI002B40848F|nr:endo-1,3;1,4-beta-D-glucanase-like [Humulus lupulus]
MAGVQCCSNPPTLDPNSGLGYLEELGGLKTYISGSSSDSKSAVLLISDVFGYEAPNIRLIADKAAAAGFYAVVPDFFNGDPYNIDGDSRPVLEWLKDHGTDKGLEDAKPVVEALKSKGFSAIGAVGFCWGGKVVTELAKSKSIEAAVLLHPSLVTLDDIKEVNIPIEILAAEIDSITPPALVEQYKEILATKVPHVDSYVEIIPKVEHGWTVRYNVDDESASKSANEAHNKMLEWFSKYLN